MLEKAAADAGFGFRVLDWKHPRQTWALFSGPAFETDWLDEDSLSWNRSLESGVWS